MKRFFYTLALCFAVSGSFAQTYVSENFNYGSNDSLVSNGWVSISGGNTNAMRANGTGLTYSGYVNSGIGNAVSMTNNGQDAVLDRSGIPATGSVYVSFMANISAAQTAGDYFFALLPTNSTSLYTARLHAKLASTGYYRVAIHKSSGTPTYSADSFPLNATHLFVIKYQFNSVNTTDDSLRLWVFTSGIPTTEPTTFTAAPSASATDATNIERFTLRQGSSSNAPTLRVDGLRVAGSWADGPLPVTFNSINVKSVTGSNLLTWSTASERNNSHFEIEKSRDGATFETIGRVAGKGTSNSVVRYQFNDYTPSAGINYYRLKQVDFDGGSEYSRTVSVRVALQREISSAPNPFTNDLGITISANSQGKASIQIFDLMGKLHHSETKVLAAGSNQVQINTTDMPDGVYFIRTDINGVVSTQKVVKK